MRHDGLMGLGRGRTSLPSQLKNKNIISDNVIIICFNKEPDKSRNPSGFMAFGKPSRIFNDRKVNWALLKRDR